MSRGIIAIGIDKDDELITARITDGQQVIFIATHDGMAIRFNEHDLRPMGRPASGNRGINLRKGDFVIGAAVTPSNEARNTERLARAVAAGLSYTSKDASTKPTTPPSAQPLTSPPPTTPPPLPPSPSRRRPSSTSSTKSSASPPA